MLDAGLVASILAETPVAENAIELFHLLVAEFGKEWGRQTLRTAPSLDFQLNLMILATVHLEGIPLGLETVGCWDR